MNSMTGYSFKESISDGIQFNVEFKSVNSRFLDLNINIPTWMNPIESEIKSLATKKIARGKVDISIRIYDENAETSVLCNTKAAKEYYDAFKKIAETLGKSADEISLKLIAEQPNVLSVATKFDAAEYWKKLLPLFNEALENFNNDRKREGENLKKDILEKISILEDCAKFFKEWQPQMEEKFRAQISTKFHELLEDKVDEVRIMTETAALLVKYTINEEIIRLSSHLEAMKDEIENNPTPGKRLDFICQEANREINTIGSKNQFIEIAQKVVVAKDALENIREQSKNIE